ncbi:MAG TPA: heparan-alpha-glucosaminide N-acetyltransferase domain-containing protein [Candidatus Lokiarchaeia archaeon]|nr:heparan-alpha-glucosaminide N-acetyltransferase domain-containing protein [Candidatus Lokiarchaeia archaeon]
MPEVENKKNSLRIRCIDYLRGLCILDMILTHGLSFWLIKSSIWLFVVEGVLFGSVGEVGFVFVSGIGFGFSAAKEAQGTTNTKDQNLRSLSHTLALLFVSICFNIAYSITNPNDVFGIVSWQILQTLAVCRLLSLIFKRVKKFERLVIAVGLFAVGSLLLNWINFGQSDDLPATIFFVLLYNPLPYYPIMIFFPIFLIGTALGEDFNKVSQNPTTFGEVSKQWVVIGSYLLFTGFILGFPLETQTPYNGRDLLSMLHTNPSIQITTYPLFLDLNSYAWCLFFSGVIILLAISLFYYLDLKNAGKSTTPAPRPKGILDLYGRYSLTIYLGHYAAFLIPPQWDASGIWLPTLALLLGIWLIIWILDKKGKGKYSLEFLLSFTGESLYRKLKKKMESSESDHREKREIRARTTPFC